MGKVAVFCCDEINFDVYDSERIPIGKSENLYYVTPSRLDLIAQWLTINDIDKIRTKNQIQTLISLKLIATY